MLMAAGGIKGQALGMKDTGSKNEDEKEWDSVKTRRVKCLRNSVWAQSSKASRGWCTGLFPSLMCDPTLQINFIHRNSSKIRTSLQLPQKQIKPTSSTKYLGMVMDQTLSWKVQQAHAIEKGTRWASQIRRIASTT